MQYAANKDNIKKLKEVRDTAFVPTSSGQPDVDMVEIGVSSLELEDKESIINQIPISRTGHRWIVNNSLPLGQRGIASLFRNEIVQG